MEIEILNMIQGWHTPALDQLFVFLSFLGIKGVLWIGIGIGLLCIKKYRKYGIVLLGALLLGYLVGNLFLKNAIMRQRPCWINPDITLLIKNPTDYSFPSGHTQSGFAAAMALFFLNKKVGVVAFILASGIAFSRMYLYVHYPTDIIAGILLGLIYGVVSYYLVNKVMNKSLQFN